MLSFDSSQYEWKICYKLSFKKITQTHLYCLDGVIVRSVYEMLLNTSANIVSYPPPLLAEQSDTKSNVKLGGFQSQLQASYVPSHTEEL